jgi:hypothetical protein
MILKKIGVLSLGYALAILYGILATLNGAFNALNLRGADAQALDQLSLIVYNLGWWIIPIALVAGLIGGFLAGVILAWIYNYIIVKLIGGVKLELK